MRRTAWVAAVLGLCGVLAAGDGAAARSSGPPLSRFQVRAEIDAAMSGRPSGLNLVLTSATGRDGRPLPADCVESWVPAADGEAPGYATALRAFGSAGWRRTGHSTGHGFENTLFAKGGWKLSVSRRNGSRTTPGDWLDLTAFDTRC